MGGCAFRSGLPDPPEPALLPYQPQGTDVQYRPDPDRSLLRALGFRIALPGLLAHRTRTAVQAVNDRNWLLRTRLRLDTILQLTQTTRHHRPDLRMLVPGSGACVRRANGPERVNPLIDNGYMTRATFWSRSTESTSAIPQGSFVWTADPGVKHGHCAAHARHRALGNLGRGQPPAAGHRHHRAQRRDRLGQEDRRQNECGTRKSSPRRCRHGRVIIQNEPARRHARWSPRWTENRTSLRWYVWPNPRPGSILRDDHNA